jgi:outer membrane protein assembly factor BamD
MEIGRYYLKRGHYTAAINRFRVVVEDFQTTTHTAEALHASGRGLSRAGLTDEAQTAARSLATTTSPAPSMTTAFALLNANGLRPRPRATAGCASVYRQVVRGRMALIRAAGVIHADQP